MLMGCSNMKASKRIKMFCPNCATSLHKANKDGFSSAECTCGRVVTPEDCCYKCDKIPLDGSLHETDRGGLCTECYSGEADHVYEMLSDER